MNHIYRLIWNQTLGALVPVAEITRYKNGSGASQRNASRPRLAPLSGALLLALGLAAPGSVLAAASISTAQGGSTLTQSVTQAMVAPPVNPLPNGGQVVSGQATIGQSGNTLTINQGSQNTVLNWQSFSIGADQTVTFNQPNSSSVALNRVLGSDPSAIYGHLNANGQVFLVNPNGIYFARGAQVDVGGIVASTLNITDQDFLNGNYRFAGASTAGVRNDGSINAAPGGYVAFIGANVSNNGSIATPEGTTALGAGGSVNLTLAGNSLLSFKVSSSTLSALAANGGLIQANGGTVILSAQAKDALLQTVVNNTGQIQAQTVANHHGTIELLGGDSGTVQVAGTLDASAPNGGDGGFIDTSGTHVKMADGSTITTHAASGNNGTWLIDPQDFTIAASGGDISGATLSTQLGSGNVTIQSTTGGTAGNGDIFVNDTVSWSANTLTLNAYRNIVINTAMNGSGTAGLALQYGQGSTNGVIGGVTSDYTVNAPVNLASTGSFSTKLGSSGSTINWTIITSLGAAGDATTAPGTMTLQGLAATSSLGGHYVLGANIDASATATWNPDGSGGYYGFTPIGTSTNAFSGTLGGLGHTIDSLTINRSIDWNVGLFGVVGSGGAVRSLGLTHASVTGQRLVGVLAGINRGTISNAYATGTALGTDSNVGGLVGGNSGSISNAHADVAVTVGSNSGSNATNAGGLVGYNAAGSISNAYAAGHVTAISPTGSNNNIGGLVGYSTGGSISNVYATGDVSGSADVGGLVGNNSSSISNAYATGKVHGNNNLGGLIGNNSSPVSHGYWDTTTGLATGIGANTGTLTGGGGLSTAQLAAALPSGFASSNWANAGDQTTPYLLANASFGTYSGSVILGSDTSATPTQYRVITSLTQLQNINSTGLGLNYVLGNSIDASATASWNGGAGFAPLGSNANPYQGIFDGLGYTISNLTISRTGNYIGLFGDSGGTIRNIGLVGGSVSGDASSYAVGALVGGNAGTISNAYATTAVSGYRGVGGLVGFNASTIDNAHATGLVNGSYLVGGLVGVNAGTVTGVYATGNVNGQHNIGGLVGSNSNGTGTATIDNAYATGSIGGTTNVGGLVGQNTDGTISNAYATGNVTGGIYVGGLVGDNNSSNGVHIITNAYATGNVSGSYVGGLVGSNGGTISNTYATGKVTPSTNNGFYGGLVGVAGGTVHNSYWDTTTYGSTNVGSGAGTGLTTAQLAAALPSGFTSSNWANIGNQSTPYLLANTSFGTFSGSVLLGTDTSATPAQYKVINSLTQLQNINSTGLGLNYVLGNDIDASATASWNSGTGFAPIGNNLTGTSASRFTGTFDGLGYNISNLTINQLGGAYVGLFGYTSNAAIRNIGLVNASVSGSFTVGALVGLDQGGTIDNAYATGSVISSNYAGGLVGINTGAISNTYASVSVNGGGKTGGLVGVNGGSIVNAYATGSVIGNGNGAIVGGLVGVNGTNGTITNTYAAGSVSGTNTIGALVGSNGNTSSIIGNSYWDTTTGIATGIGANNGTVNGGGGLSTAQLAAALPSGFTASVWGNGSNQTTPYLLANTGFGTYSGSVLLDTDTSATPTQYNVITTLTQLQNINSTGLGLDYVLGNRIDATATSGWNGGAGFVPIGNNTNAFTGTFDGLNFTIDSLTVKRPGSNDIGLFGVLGSGGVLRNVGVTHVTIGGQAVVGGLAGKASAGSSISNAYATGRVDSSLGTVGGLVGSNAGSISNAYAGATVSVAYVAGSYPGQGGGLVGINRGSIDNAYATGIVGGGFNTIDIGGLVGANFNGSINNAYATGTVWGGDDVGGLVGGLASGTVSNAYATGNVSGSNTSVGRLIGASTGAVSNGYWDTSVTGTLNGFGNNSGTTTGGGGLTTAQLAAALPSGFSSSVWANAGNQTSPYLLANASFDTYSGSVSLGTDASATPAQYKVITSLTQLQNINSTGLSLDYVLGNNIDALATASWNGGAGFVPIGDSTTHFSGIFDGLGHSISSLTVNRPSTYYVGLFGYSSGTLRKVGLLNSSINGLGLAGALVGRNGGTVAYDYAIGGSVTVAQHGAGGLVGQSSGTIKDSYATDSVAGLNSGVASTAIGGLVGSMLIGSTTSNSYATGSVSGAGDVGGLVGQNSGTVSTSYWDTTTSGTTTGIGAAYSGATASGASGLTSAQMLQQSNFTGFDFGSPVWVIYNGHTMPLLNVFLTPLTVTATSQSQTYSGGTFALLNPSYSVAGADTSGHLFGLSDPYSGAVNVGSYSPDLWSDQQGYRITYVGGALTITPKALTLSGLTAANKIYDGSSAASVTGWGSLSGIVGSDAVSLINSSASAAFADANAGIGKTVTVNGLSLTGAGAGNYVINAQTTTADITPKALTLSGLTASNKVYDGTTAANISGWGSLVGIIGSDAVSLVTSGSSADFADANVGTGKAVTVGGLTLGGSAAGNYTFVGTQTVFADITPAPLTASLIGTISKPYDGTNDATLDAGNFLLSGFAAGQGASVTQTQGQYASSAIGTGIPVSVDLSAGNFTANAGTLLRNYLLPTLAIGTGSITGSTMTPQQTGALASASQSTARGYAGIDSFGFSLDPRAQWQRAAPGASGTVRLTIQDDGGQPCHGDIGTFVDKGNTEGWCHHP
ncbi:MAG: GLUG motif-containing protein [Pseudomonadota bacterium]